MTALHHDDSLTSDPMTDALVPLVSELAEAVFDGDADAIADVRERAERTVVGCGGQAADAGWAMAVVAAAMLPGGVPPRLLLAWRGMPHVEPTYAPPRGDYRLDQVVRELGPRRRTHPT